MSSGVVGAAVVRHPTRVAVVETEERTPVVGALGVRLVPVEGSAFRVWSGAVVTRMAELRVIDSLLPSVGGERRHGFRLVVSSVTVI